MNAEQIREALTSEGFDVTLVDDLKLEVRFDIRDTSILLTHEISQELLRVPKFFLANGHGLGKLAHVLTDGFGDGGEVCIADSDSTSVNLDRPDLVYSQTIRQHIELLTRLKEDPAYNRAEQIREFRDHWRILCGKSKKDIRELFVAWDGAESDVLEVRVPKTSSGSDLATRPCAIAKKISDAQVSNLIRTHGGLSKRPVEGAGIALVTQTLEPPPPSIQDLPNWYFCLMSRLTSDSERFLAELPHKKRRDYWVVLSAPLPNGRTYFAIHWTSETKKALPTSAQQVQSDGWTLTPYEVRLISHKSLVQRGGGALGLTEKSVLLVGCGSVGSELAHRLASAGIGELVISDPDLFREENLYRHTLSLQHIGLMKSESVANQIMEKYPWVKTKSRGDRLENLREREFIDNFDLIAIAIGSPTVERIFSDFCRSALITVPTINCWTEAYEIGGHATLVVPNSTGCLHCAYVNPDTLCRGLASNLNFLASDQVIMRNEGGCGTQYLPFSSTASNQTASMAANLAVQHLLGDVTESSRVSWRGSSKRAAREHLVTTYRYRHFTDSLKIEPLYNDNCDVCSQAS